MSRIKHYKGGEAYSIEHLGRKEIDLDIADPSFLKEEEGGRVPYYRYLDLLVQKQKDEYKVLGWIDSVEQNSINYITIPLKLQKNCRAFLRGSPIGIEGKISFDEKRVPLKK